MNFGSDNGDYVVMFRS